MFLFVIPAIVGFVVLFLVLITGGDHDVEHEVDVGHEIDTGDIDHGPSLISIKMLCLIAIGFGVAGAIAKYNGGNITTSSIWGIGGAAVLGAIGYFLLGIFYRSQASSTITDRDYLGITGRLTVGIPEGGKGQMICVLGGRTFTLTAQSKNEEEIAVNSAVKVVEKIGDTVIVEKI
jgi:membrane-bound ClpP family serine protease